jgi:hypothetical protein
VPASLIDQEDGVAAGRDGFGDFDEMQDKTWISDS